MQTIIFLFSIGVFLLGYFFYGKFISRKVLGLDDRRITPAHELRDDVDYVPAPAPVLFGHHFSSIAGAGPIIGPIIAGASWGWLPTLLWILIGCIFIGAVHDESSIAVSIRNKAKSIAEISGTYLSKKTGLILKIFIWLALMYVIAVFVNIAQIIFNSSLPVFKNGKVINSFSIGAGVATSSIIYILLAIIFGYLTYRKKFNLFFSTIIFVSLVYLSIYLGKFFPIYLSPSVWKVLILIYAGIASFTPVWLLLQPRDYLSSFLLYGVVIATSFGILFSFGKIPVTTPAFKGFNSQIGPLFPLLFVVVACGAVSGFHSLVGSGTTSKQLNKETDALKIGYGAMLVEGVIAVMSLLMVMSISPENLIKLKKNIGALYGLGVSKFLNFLGISPEVGMAFGMVALSSFILTTVDTSTRIARYTFSELTGIKNRYISTFISLIIPGVLVFIQYRDPVTHKLIPVWKALWPVFGATNQLIAALALFVITAWLIKIRKHYWIFTGLPGIFVCGITIWALIMLLLKWKLSVVGIASLIQIFLAFWVLLEGSKIFKTSS
jgi:carbon starvation protein